MSRNVILRLGKLTDANKIALMSRDLIERGLAWSWTPERIAEALRCPDSTVLAACDQERLIGFAIMEFGLEDAHLNLLAVKPIYQRSGIGRRLLEWLEQSARVAGITTIYLEVRVHNEGARRFYQAVGYREIARVPRYYGGREPAIRMACHLHARIL